MIKEAFGTEYCWVPITYKQQGEKKWTGAALQGIYTTEDVIVVYSDSIFSTFDVERLLHYDGYGCLVQEVEAPEKYGIFSVNSSGNAQKVIEKPTEDVGNLANIWYYKFSPAIFDYIDSLEPSPRGEYELTDAINEFCKWTPFHLFDIEWYFLDISYPDDIPKAESYLHERSKDILSRKPDFWESLFIDNVKNFTLHLWLKQEHISDLIRYSQDQSDTALQENTGDKKRFQNEQDIQKWYEDTQRYVFSLVSHEWELAGIWWARACTAPEISKIEDKTAYDALQANADNLHTNAIRIYPAYRGQKIATPFANICSLHYRDMFPDAVMCIDTNVDNIPLQKSYEKWGYEKVWIGESDKSVPSEQERYVYIQSKK